MMLHCMRSLADFAIQQEYERIRELGDKLVRIGNIARCQRLMAEMERFRASVIQVMQR